MSSRLAAIVVLASLLIPGTTSAQEVPIATVRSELVGQFDASARKLVGLAEAMPAESYDWQPMEGVYTVARVYAHIARYNYMYPDQNMGIEAPVAYGDFETELTTRAEVTEALAASMDHVRTVIDGMSDARLAERTTLYGRDVAKWSVLLQLVTHMNEHLGQAIAYARMNGVAPPWSR